MKRRINVSVESIMVILLMILFSVAISVLIFEGSVTYRKIITNKNEEENTRIALSYVNMRIKQNDMTGHITVDQDSLDGEDVLVIHHHDDEEGLMSYIYFKDGFLWECYTDGLLDHSLSSEIIAISGIEFDYLDGNNAIVTTVPYRNNQDYINLTQVSALRTASPRLGALCNG